MHAWVCMSSSKQCLPPDYVFFLIFKQKVVVFSGLMNTLSAAHTYTYRTLFKTYIVRKKIKNSSLNCVAYFREITKIFVMFLNEFF